jgi:plasmid stabilization system protein ParE
MAQDSVARAEKTCGRILQAVDRLETFPLIGPEVPEFESSGLRELIVRPYRVLYVTRENVCWIVAVVHGSRDLSRLIRPEDLPGED